jgi:hypothetical protein
MADVDLTITIPDVYLTKVITAFTLTAGADIRLEIVKDDIRSEWQFVIDPQGDDTLMQFGQRFIRELGKAVVNAVSKREDETRYKAEISAITLPTSDVPTDILI